MSVQTARLPFLVTPPFPEYPSAHSSQSGAAAAVIAAYFGANSPFVAISDVLPGVTRSFPGVDVAQDEIADARIFGGKHLRTACRDARTMDNAIGEFVLENILSSQVTGTAMDIAIATAGATSAVIGNCSSMRLPSCSEDSAM
jgi:hypothetical protein